MRPSRRIPRRPPRRSTSPRGNARREATQSNAEVVETSIVARRKAEVMDGSRDEGDCETREGREEKALAREVTGEWRVDMDAVSEEGRRMQAVGAEREQSQARGLGRETELSGEEGSRQVEEEGEGREEKGEERETSEMRMRNKRESESLCDIDAHGEGEMEGMG